MASRLRVAREMRLKPEGSSLAELDPDVRVHFEEYGSRLGLNLERLWVTTKRPQFECWISRRIGSRYGGAYTYSESWDRHLILINVEQLNPENSRAIELVVAEELIHMSDFLKGDRRRHAKHGYDRIARRVAELTGATHEEIRSCMVPAIRRPVRYHYACPACGIEIGRRKRGVWSCSRCSPQFDQRFVLQLVREVDQGTEVSDVAARN